MVEKPFTRYVPESVSKRWEEEDNLALSCPKCGGKFFIELDARRYAKELPPTNYINKVPLTNTLSLGQRLPPNATVSFPIYMCVTKDCHTLVVPPIDGGEETGPRTWSLYNELCDSIEGKKKE